MGEVHQLPDVRDVEREASEWIARLQADDASADDWTRFEAWRAAHPNRAEAYEKLMGTWQRFAVAGPLVRAVSFAQSVSEPDKSYAPRRWPWAAAAVLVFAAALTTMYMTYMPTGERFTTAVGEQVTIALSDGSKVQLNSNTIARVDYNDQARIIHLEQGEAFFRVAHDVQRPFWVASGRSWVRAVGTAFNVHVRPKDVQVIVSEGVVKVGYVESGRSDTPSDAALTKATTSMLAAGQQAELNAAITNTRGLSEDELSRAVSWLDGVLYFENQTLGEVIDQVGRYTTLRLVIDDTKLRELVIGGTFQANPQGAEALLSMLEQGLGLKVRRDGASVYIGNTG